MNYCFLLLSNTDRIQLKVNFELSTTGLNLEMFFLSSPILEGDLIYSFIPKVIVAK